MSKIPEPTDSTVNRIYAHYEANADDFRPHLGASLIGHECERHLWYVFRWAVRPKFSGRMLRLFQTGHLAESRFEADLKAVGIDVHTTDENGHQFRVNDLNGHFSGSLDGAGRGFVEAPKSWHVLEFKTHSEKSFKELQAKGVKEAKPLHFDQMQTYMHLTGMPRAFYLAVNKNNDELYQERVKHDPAIFARLRMKAERVITAKEPLEKLSEDPSFYKCKGYKDEQKALCDHYFICHQSDAPAVNCRTCVHSTPELSGGYQRWTCAYWRKDLTTQEQRAACKYHLFIPSMLSGWADMLDASFTKDAYFIEYRNRYGDKAIFKNGPDFYASYELHHGAAEIIGDDFADELKEKFGARINE